MIILKFTKGDIMIEKKLTEILINFYNHSFTIIDKDEKVIYWSDRASEIFNLKNEEVVGKDIKEIFSDNFLIFQVEYFRSPVAPIDDFLIFVDDCKRMIIKIDQYFS